jgi:Lrp/AsnC family leucine-responsive transcriptional regulator
MDSIDYQILRKLQENGRISIKKLAEEINLTPPAVSERVKKLEETGAIKGYRAVIDPEKLGFNIQALINITLKTGKRIEFYNFARENKCIVECHHVTGGFSVTVKAVLKEMSELETLVGKIQQFGTTQTLIILSTPIENKGIYF